MKNRPQEINGVPVPYDAALSELVHMIENVPDMRNAAFVALGCSGEPSAVAVLDGYLDSSDRFIRRLALETIGRHPQGACLENRIIKCLSDKSEYVVRTACNVVRDLHLQAAHARVLELLEDTDEYTRICAIDTLDSIWERSDFKAIFDRFKNDGSPEVRKKAAWTLRQHVAADNWRTLSTAWMPDPIPRHRSWSCEIVQQFGDCDCIKDLRGLLTDSDGHVRRAAARAIEILESHEVRP